MIETIQKTSFLKEKIHPSRFHTTLKAFKKNPKSTTFAPLSDLFRRVGNFKMALKLCKHGLKHHPKLPQAYSLLGRIHYDQGHYLQSSQAFETACDLEPDNISALQYLGKIYLYLKDAEQSLKIYERILLYHPEQQWAKELTKKLHKIHLEKFSHFSVHSLRDISHFLSQREFQQQTVLKPYKASQSSKKKHITPSLNEQDLFNQMSESVPLPIKTTPHTSIPESVKKEVQLKKLKNLLNQLSSKAKDIS